MLQFHGWLCSQHLALKVEELSIRLGLAKAVVFNHGLYISIMLVSFENPNA